ncbi:MAG TPA: DUF4112 domain-containing protein [Vicinamibacterales bacterium]|nr:DUF4112 domain-containing protein [Vicinamibacterales bacterium]
MLEALLFWLVVSFLIAIVLGVALYFVTQWLFMRTAERMARVVDRSVGGAAAHALTRLAKYAQAHGIGIDDANRLFGVNVDRLAKIMDSAIKLPIVGRIGLDAVLDLIPVFGNFAGAAVSLTLIARTLQFGPPPSLVSKMLSNVLVDVILGGIPLIGPLADIWWRANDRNAALMREFLDGRPTGQPS